MFATPLIPPRKNSCLTTPTGQNFFKRKAPAIGRSETGALWSDATTCLLYQELAANEQNTAATYGNQAEGGRFRNRGDTKANILGFAPVR